jgi:hypothetical protein
MTATAGATVVAPPLRSYSVRRYYDPQTGQFISVDALVDQTETPYGYAGQDPINNYDLDGTVAAAQLDAWMVNPTCEATGCGGGGAIIARPSPAGVASLGTIASRIANLVVGTAHSVVLPASAACAAGAVPACPIASAAAAVTLVAGGIELLRKPSRKGAIEIVVGLASRRTEAVVTERLTVRVGAASARRIVHVISFAIDAGERALGVG